MTTLAYKDEENDFDDDQDQDAYNQQSGQDDESNGPNRNGQWCRCRRFWADWGERCSVNSLHDYVLMLCPQVHLLTETFAITVTILTKW